MNGPENAELRENQTCSCILFTNVFNERSGKCRTAGKSNMFLHFAPVSALTVNAKTRQNVKKRVGCGLKTPVHRFGSNDIKQKKHEKREKTRSVIRYKLVRACTEVSEMEIFQADIQF